MEVPPLMILARMASYFKEQRVHLEKSAACHCARSLYCAMMTAYGEQKVWWKEIMPAGKWTSQYHRCNPPFPPPSLSPSLLSEEIPSTACPYPCFDMPWCYFADLRNEAVKQTSHDNPLSPASTCVNDMFAPQECVASP